MRHIKKPLVTVISITLIILLCNYSSGEYMRGLGTVETVFLELPELPSLPGETSFTTEETTAAQTEPEEPPPVTQSQSETAQTTSTQTQPPPLTETPQTTMKKTTTGSTVPETEPPPPDPYQESVFVYGTSEMGRSLSCVKLKSETSCGDISSQDTYKILLVFEIHGFEDAYYKDGVLLVAIANRILDYYRANIGMLNGCELYVVASANPDGLSDGYSNNGFGRCQASGYDINREFDTGLWSPCYSERNKTGETPLVSVESKALADLVLSLKPDIVIDFHGWLDMCIGDRLLYEYFNIYRPMNWHSASEESGYFADWAAGVASRAMLYEFPWPTGYEKNYFIKTCAGNVTNGLNKIFLNIEDVVSTF